MKKIFFVVGDKSADLFTNLVCRRLKEISPQVKLYSFGGKYLKETTEQLFDLTSCSVSGITEVFSHLKKILHAFNLAYETINRISPDLIVLVDFPDFNLKLAKKINNRFPVIYYISPQVWAWRRKRVNVIKKYIKKLLVIFEFEQDFYRRYNLDVSYVGHPLGEITNPFLSFSEKKENYILLMPGSRKNEIKKHLPLMLKAAEIIQKRVNTNFYILKAQNIEEAFYKKAVKGKIPLLNHSYKAIAKANFAITSSGTATLECALLNTPFLAVYKINFLSWLIAKNMVKVPFIAMPNILAKEEIAPELIQFKATAQNIAQKVQQIIKDPSELARIKEGLETVRKKVSLADASLRAAEEIINAL